MRYLHTMLRVRDLDAALDFYCNKLGMKETRRRVDEKNRYTLVFLADPPTKGWSRRQKRRSRARSRNSPTTGMRRTMARRDTLGISPMKWTTSTRPATG